MKWTPASGRAVSAESDMRKAPARKKPTGLPAWFLENCCATRAELKEREPPLKIQGATPEESNQNAVSKSRETGTQESRFEIDLVVYEALHAVLSWAPGTPTPHGSDAHGQKQNETSHHGPFRNDAMLIRLSNKRSGKGAPRFLQSVVEMFAMEIGADLVTLSMDDIEDLAQYLILSESEGKPSAAHIVRSEPHDPDPEAVPGQYLHHFFADDRCFSVPERERHRLSRFRTPRLFKWKNKTEKLLDSKPLKAELQFPFLEILQAPLVRTTGIASLDVASTSPPLILHLPEVHRLYHSRRGRGEHILRSLSSEVARQNQVSRRILVVSSSHELSAYLDNEILRLSGVCPMNEAVRVVPARAPEQTRLLERGEQSGAYDMQRNIRALQRMVREAVGCGSPLLTPYVPWDFLDGSKAAESLGKRLLPAGQVETMKELMRQDLSSKNIKKVIEGAGLRNEILSKWDEEGGDDRWSGFPPKIRTIIKEIRQGGESENSVWEQDLLELVVNPEAIEEGWDDIELEPDVRDEIMQMVDQPSLSGRSAYGVLKRGKIGGAILYGPPGTGKTHLARVLSRECQLTMISASAADIQSKWVGETEKAIKALFRLGRKMAPSIIFIDEADALFASRAPSDRSWERSRVNQLLTEMDGLVKVKTPPFVLLATNIPQHLDSAVMRRASSKLHIGLPAADARERIFGICLREEQMDADVDLRSLALRTTGYCGSDILTICVQAALICEADEASKGVKDSVRMLKKTHFDKAMMRTTPTVSTASLKLIREFARENHPSAWEKMNAREKGSRGTTGSTPVHGTADSARHKPYSTRTVELNGSPSVDPVARLDLPESSSESSPGSSSTEEIEPEREEALTLNYFPMKPDIISVPEGPTTRIFFRD